MFRVVVTPDLGTPLAVVLPAVDGEQAIRFAKNRWPNAKGWEIGEA